MFKCPICQKEYNESHFDVCECGFSDFHAYHDKEELLFQIFKYTKNVYLNRIHYPKSKLEEIYEDEGISFVDLSHKARGLEYVASYENKETCISNGFLAFQYHTKALILDCEYAHKEFLDESNLRILFLGKNFKGFIGEVKHMDKIVYLYVDKDNPFFESQNNKLVKK